MSLRDPFGQFPAPISNPEAWPPNYADGFNQAVHLMTEAFPSVLAALAVGRAESAEARAREAEDMLAWFANNPYAYRIMADKCSEAAAFLAARGQSPNRREGLSEGG